MAFRSSCLRAKKAGEARGEKWRLILIRTRFTTRIDFIEYELARIKSTVEPEDLNNDNRWKQLLEERDEVLAEVSSLDETLPRGSAAYGESARHIKTAWSDI